MAIRALDKSSVQKICCGQVIIDLTTAVKELVENSLDSGATLIDVKLSNFGLDSIEVSDNGSGIDESDFNSIALKHHTSKLAQFSDLEKLNSFGFRGEALNALCELSGSFSVTTRKKNGKIGFSLVYSKNGNLESKKIMNRSDGTTITIGNLFDSLPVRRREFERSIKKHYQKLIRVLQAYALISVGIRVQVTNSMKASRQSVLSSQSSTSLADNISTIFGNKFLETMSEINFSFDSSSSEGENSSSDSSDPLLPFLKLTSIHGFVSRVGEGVGRNDSDRQFLFLNGRPVDLPQITRALNEIWRRYEMKHKPAFILNLHAPSASLDLNLTPDKREVIITHMPLILEALRHRLETLFSPSRSTFSLSQGLAQSDAQPLIHSFLSPNLHITSNFAPSWTTCEEDSEMVANESQSDPSDPSPTPSQSPSKRLRRDVPLPYSSNSSYFSWQVPSSSVIFDPQEDSSCINLSLTDRSQFTPLHDPSSSSSESRLSRTLDKLDFSHMRVLGQFNLGFILCEVSGDMYILDQHACDEKHRFENLLLNSKIHSQPLVCPMPISISPSEEDTLSSHLPLLESLGFRIRFEPNTSASAGSRVSLLALPSVQGVQFGEEDVHEIASLLANDRQDESQAFRLLIKNSGPEIDRKFVPPKLMTHFASKACRGAVMIGTALTSQEMAEIVHRMEKMEQPWNCPHGRPTMRHLIELESVLN